MKTIELDSLTFSAMLRQGAVSLSKDKKVINDLNVFPIPDGDTGDNMLMTLKAGCNAVKDNLGTLAELASAASSGMLLGARGNSGVILSRIFAGLAKGLQDVIVADTNTFAKAMDSAVAEAYKAVPVPVEGTIITVLREGAAGADASQDLNHYFETLLEAMQVSLDHTPELLQVLKDAGVVDSGGAGLLSIFRGMNDALNGKISEEDIEPTTATPVPTVELNKFDENSKLEFGYCTEFLLRLMRSKVDLDSFDENVIFDYLNKVGESVVAFREGSIVKVHVHTFTPGEILNYCQQFGEFLTLKIENMTYGIQNPIYAVELKGPDGVTKDLTEIEDFYQIGDTLFMYNYVDEENSVRVGLNNNIPYNGAYTMTVHSHGFKDMSITFTVTGGENPPVKSAAWKSWEVAVDAVSSTFSSVPKMASPAAFWTPRRLCQPER